MMHGHEKSDSAIVAKKLPNKAGKPAAEAVERRAGTKGNAGQQSTLRTQIREGVSQALDRVRKAARQRKKEKFTALLHHISVKTLHVAFYALKRKAAPGVDGVTWQEYEADLERRLADLHARIHRGAYRPQPSRRTYIPKADGRQRPLAIAALEDKIVQGATVMVLNAIYEEDFLGFSYGFRPGRGAHDALDALAVGITKRKVNYILDADIRSFFDSVSQEWLVRFVEHRIGDKRIIRLIRKWLRAGILEDGTVTVSERGTGQGSVASPLLANIYLHYVFDLWAERWRRQEATGDMIIVRYADDLVLGFQHESDAHRFLDAMRARFEEFALSLHPDKTRLIEFGRHAAVRRARNGLGKPETFNFLGFTFICGRSRRGSFSAQAEIPAGPCEGQAQGNQGGVAAADAPADPRTRELAGAGSPRLLRLPCRAHQLRGARQIQAPNRPAMAVERSGGGARRIGHPGRRMAKLAADFLPKPKILHPWPAVRFAAKHPR